LEAGWLIPNLLTDGAPGIFMEAAYSELLWDVLEDQYHRLGFGIISDEVFMRYVSWGLVIRHITLSSDSFEWWSKR
jgi:hypothetical protein